MLFDRRPIAVIQCGDGLENRQRILPLALSLKDAGWFPTVFVDRFERGGAMFLAHGVGVIPMATAPVPKSYRPQSVPTLNELCPLDMQRAWANGGRLQERKNREIFRRYSYVLDRIRPGMICVWNGYTGATANALRCYKDHHGISGGYMERGIAGNSIFYDSEGVNGFSALARGTVQTAEPPTSVSPHLQKYHDQLDAGARRSVPRILVPLQVQDDSNILLFGNRMLKMRDLVSYAVKFACAMGEDWKVVVRPHPEERPNTRLNLPQHERIEIDDVSSLEETILSTSICLTINSTVGLEAAFLGATTICLGEGIYCREPFVLQGQDRPVSEVVAEARDRLADPCPHEAKKRNFLYRIQSHHQVAYRTGSTASGRIGEWREAAQRMRPGLRETVARALRRSHSSILHRSATLPQVWRRMQKLDAGPPLEVHVFLKPRDRLFLTYRNVSERITQGYLVSMLEERGIPMSSLSRMDTPGLGRGRIAILHSESDLDLSDYDLVLDEYGYPHVKTYR
ncbi:hypothetical protein PAF17_11350 [Paracoccus sp. Z330]|uniref:Capsular biosynthesis protein n=1 Tax=Paracoccus onchidii TaxID=3017813 RepID=A0ABT4ZFG5_9RHOB|nr:hypothetical protein [Paracoccus onchidii]MDB6178093.1 hypothetical protein [Paracoccus onchidii]